MAEGEYRIRSEEGTSVWAERGRRTIEEHYARIESISSLCADLGISSKLLRESFLFAYHTTPKRYLDFVRVTKAEELVKEGRMRIYEIAMEVGFRSVSVFERTFIRVTGVCPSEFRCDACHGPRAENVVRKCGTKTPISA